MTVFIRLYDSLNRHLPRGWGQSRISLILPPGSHVREALARLGVPDTAVDLALVNGRSVDFNHPLEDGDRLSLYPAFEALDISSVTRLPDRPLRRPRFVLDAHLGKLARYLRLLGLDALYRPEISDDELIECMWEDHRALLTRDRPLLERRHITFAYEVRSEAPRRQVVDVVNRFDLLGTVQPFTRCLDCNHPVEAVSREAVRPLLKPEIHERHSEFRQCTGCRNIYWPGTHWQRMHRMVRSIQREVLALQTG